MLHFLQVLHPTFIPPAHQILDAVAFNKRNTVSVDELDGLDGAPLVVSAPDLNTQRRGFMGGLSDRCCASSRSFASCASS